VNEAEAFVPILTYAVVEMEVPFVLMNLQPGAYPAVAAAGTVLP
jgi:hypothetical protein